MLSCLTRQTFIGILFLLQYSKCQSEELPCPKHKKDIQWMNGKNDLEGSDVPKSANECQIWCQEFVKVVHPCPYNGAISCPYMACAGWSFWAEPGPLSSSTWCYLFQNNTETLESTSSPAPGAISGFVDDCGIGHAAKGPTIGQYFLEGVEKLDRRYWKNFLPNDTDTDQDGTLSDNEIGHKFNSYMGELFKNIDQNEDSIVTEDELQSLRFDVPQHGHNKFVDFAVETWPVKSLWLVADGNNDGVIDDNDFYRPEKLAKELPFYDEIESVYTDVKLKYYYNDGYDESGFTVQGKVALYSDEANICDIGENEGNVICNSLGFNGLERIDNNFQSIWNTWEHSKYTCNGTEKALENCRPVERPERCVLSDIICNVEIGSLRLVGGKDSSSGDIFAGNYGVAYYDYYDNYLKTNIETLSKVVCRELGFSGFIKVTKGSTFSNQIQPKLPMLPKIFECTGYENKLEDCQHKYHRLRENVRSENEVHGVICKTDIENKTVEREHLEQMFNWDQNVDIWEKFGKFIFVSTSYNKKGQRDLTEVSRKVKVYLKTILHLVDQTGDGYISLEDFTSLNLTMEPIEDFINTFFLSNNYPEIDLLKPIFMTRDVGEYIPWIRTLEKNFDKKLNAADFYSRGKIQEMAQYMIPAISHKLDKNQDGKIKFHKLRVFIREVFNKLDGDKNGALTLDDGYALLRKQGYSCLQVLQIQTYINQIKSIMKDNYWTLMNYLFKDWDYDGNEKVTLQEFQKIHLPCRMHYENDERPIRRIVCEHIYNTFYRFDMRSPIISFLKGHFPVLNPSNRGGDWANAACEMMP